MSRHRVGDKGWIRYTSLEACEVIALLHFGRVLARTTKYGFIVKSGFIFNRFIPSGQTET